MLEIFKAAIQRGASDIHIKAGDFLRAMLARTLITPLPPSDITGTI